MKKQLIGISLILLGILFGITNEVMFGHASEILGVVFGIVGFIIVIAYGIDKKEG